MNAASWAVLALAVVVFGAAAYRYSLGRNQTRACHSCGGTGTNRAWVWWYAKGECRAKTLLPPRAQCDRGRVPRWGRRLLNLDDEK